MSQKERVHTRNHIQEPEESSLPSEGGIINFRELSLEETEELKLKLQRISYEKSKLNLAKTAITGYFVGLILCCSYVVGCNYLAISANDAKWVLDKYGASATPFALAIVLYYFGDKAKQN